MESIHLTEITRDQATEWLEQTTHNRKVLDRSVKALARDMDNGRWRSEIAPPILIDEDGVGGVIDGQHRLWAFIMSGLETFSAYVMHVPRKDIAVVDTGRGRSLADTLKIRGHDHVTARSAWANRASKWALNNRLSHGMTRTLQVEFVEAAPNLDKAIEVIFEATGSAQRVLHIPVGVSLTLWDMQQYGVGGDLVVEFVKRLTHSQELDHLLSRLQRKMLDSVNPRTRLIIPPDNLSYLIARAFHAWVDDEEVANLYGRRNAVLNLPGYDEWKDANAFHLAENGGDDVEAIIE